MKKQVNFIWIIIMTLIIIVQLIFIIKLSFNNDIKNQIINDKEAVEDNILPDIASETTASDEGNADVPEEIIYKQGMFSWEPTTIEEADRAVLYKVIEYLEINEVYQYFEKLEADDICAYNLAKELNDMDVDLYILAGAGNWTYRPDGKPMLDEISRVAAIRDNWGDDMLTGIVFDIEPYASEKWAQGKEDILIANYIAGMKAAYTAAKKEDIRIILCVPTWYDTYHNALLTELFNYSDEIFVMNYGREHEYENMIDEINYAKDLGKDIACIFEFQAVGEYNLTDEQTYNNLGVEAAITSFEDLYKKVDYTKLKFAYHYLRPVQDLLNLD